MWLKRCHSPMMQKANPGATWPLRLPILIFSWRVVVGLIN